MNQNALIHSTSPYLLQHAHNPVNWNPWNKEVLERAKSENKLMIVSIGYSACHWCHVMERESFEDLEVASLMNEFFVSIKIDREERPDVDQVYMDACQLISGRGGWPLNAICLPDARPIYVGTYFNKAQWMHVLNFLQNEFSSKPFEMEERAEQILKGIQMMDKIDFVESNLLPDQESRDAIFNQLNQIVDHHSGGTKGAPKFMMPIVYEMLLQNYAYTKNPNSLKIVKTTMNSIVLRGVYDHVEGGFMRYAVDDEWEIPHFEKMLYDNGQLIGLLSKVYRVIPNEDYKQAVYQSINFIKHAWKDENGCFYSAYDADSEGVEGKYYVYDFLELKEILGDDFEWASKFFKLEIQGNFEDKIHLNRLNTFENHVREMDIPLPILKEKYDHIIHKLKEIRTNRTLPGLDNKVLTSWNALMITGLIEAYRTFEEPEFLDLSIKAYLHLTTNRGDGHYQLLRVEKISGFLEDYAFMIDASIQLYMATGDEIYLNNANQWMHFIWKNFENKNSPLFYFTSSLNDELIARKSESTDNVIPSSNSSLAHSLMVLALLMGNEKWKMRSIEMLQSMEPFYLKHPSHYAGWARLNDWAIEEPKLVVVAGENSLEICKVLQQKFSPDLLVFPLKQKSELPSFQNKFPAKSGALDIFLCHNHQCDPPVNSIKDLYTKLNLN